MLGFVKASRPASLPLQVQQVFEDMYTAGLQPNIMTYITLMNAYAKLGEWQLAVQLIEHMCQPQVGQSASLSHFILPFACMLLCVRSASIT